MTLPEGWEWLDELPPEWSPPAELRSPTGVPRVDLPIKMLSSGTLGNHLIDLVGQFTSEGARFSIWFATEAKSKASSPRELALLSLTVTEQVRRVYDAWLPFIDAYIASNARIGAFESEQSTLETVLNDSLAVLKKARTCFD